MCALGKKAPHIPEIPSINVEDLDEVDGLAADKRAKTPKAPGTGMPERPAPAALTNPRADIAALSDLERHLYAHRYARESMECFGPSIDPEAATEDRGEALAIFEEEDQALLCSPETGGLLDRLSTLGHILTQTQEAQVRILKRDRAKLVGVPSEVQAAFTRLTTTSDEVWRKAKAADDWASFEPYLDRVVGSMRKIAGYRNAAANPYDVWLDDFEVGTSRAFYDAFFKKVKEVVVPLLADIRQKGWQPDRSILKGRFDVSRQWALARDLMDLEGIDPRVTFLTSTEHPFSGSLTTNYSIIAAHVYPEDVASNVFTMLHEGGHSLYETGVNPAYNYTSLAGGTSSGIHEAQSRFFENYVGRSRAFAPHVLSAMAKHFRGQLGRVTPNQFYQAVNRAEAGPIRVEADELTYPLHILVRYEIEQLLMEGEASAKDVPRIWADLYKKYLGVNVRSNAEGALQDTHWADGLLGYFPTYALGGAYGAQLRHQMIAEGMDWERQLGSGNLAPIREWLRTRIWQYGRSKDPDELIRAACGEPFSPRYYTDYLVEKFSAIYGL